MKKQNKKDKLILKPQKSLQSSPNLQFDNVKKQSFSPFIQSSNVYDLLPEETHEDAKMMENHKLNNFRPPSNNNSNKSTLNSMGLN